MAACVAAVIVAAGRGLRAGTEIPKQYRHLDGEAVIRTTLRRFAAHPTVALVQPVIHPDEGLRFNEAAAGLDILPPVAGGATRQASVCAGLEALVERRPDQVLIHDGARPFVSAGLITRAIEALEVSQAAVPGLALIDTVKQIDTAGRVTATLDRARLRSVQTPQAFAFAALLAAHRRAQREGRDDFTDDAALIEWSGESVATFAGEPGNVKLTTAEDFRRAEAASWAALGDIRTATGFDVHAFGPGDHVTLAGVHIPHDSGLVGHSDADAVLHALTDAILGAISDGDIGVHFPPSDPQWRGASSDRFMKFAIERVRQRGGRIGHLDVTVICEAPRIGPYREAMRDQIAAIAEITPDRVGIKATTSEKLGFTGRREGIAALATATVRLPWTTS